MTAVARRILVVALLALGAFPELALAQDGVVRVTAARANLRSEPKDQAPVVSQVTAGTDLLLKAIEGDWFRVQLPPDPRLGNVRVEAYISKKVARLITPPAPSAEPAAPAAPEPRRDAMAVGVQQGSDTSWLTAETARLRTLVERVDSAGALAGVLPIADPPVAAQGAAPVTYAWTVDGPKASVSYAQRRPTFIVMFKDVPGFTADDIAPVLVRVTPALSGVRIVGLVRARADQASRTMADWDLMKDFKQETLRATVELPEPGAARVQPAADLPPGEYAVVLRPNGRKKLAGPEVFAGTLFTTAWTFSIK